MKRLMIKAFKLGGCVDCRDRPVEAGGEREMRELEIDHRIPEEKDLGGTETSVAYWARWGFVSPRRLYEELVKCDVVCYECHKKRHGADKWPQPGQLTFTDPDTIPHTRGSTEGRQLVIR